MDTLTIQSELAKIQQIHETFDENNAMTFIIFVETHRDKLSPMQIEMLENRITSITNKERERVNRFIETVDYDLLVAPLSEKMEDTGVMRIL
jgi:hypothetical protein